MCDTPTNPVAAYNPTTHTYVWSCDGDNGGSNTSCQASASYCGDGIVGTGIGYTNQEQCDNGTGNGVNGTCSVSCQRVAPTCPANLSFTPNNGVASLNVTGRWSLATGTIALSLNWQSGSVITNPSSGAAHIYSLTGTYTPTLTIANVANTGIQQLCTGSVTVTDTPTPGVCGPRNGTMVYSLSGGSSGLCPDGQVVEGFNFTAGFNGGGVYTWVCKGPGGNSPTCNATQVDANAALPFNLSLNKSITSTGPYYSGSTVNYRIDFRNTSDDDQLNVNIKDILPAGQQIIPGSFGYYDVNVVNPIQTGSSPLERNISTLYSNQTGYIIYSTRITANSGTQINTATILPSTGTETIPFVS